MLDRTTGEVRFGDGRHGTIPTANVRAPVSNIVARHWQSGGGAVRSVGASTLTTLATVVPGIRSVRNDLPATGGTDDESVDAAKLRAPAELKAKGRAVTAKHFELLAGTAPANVARAHAMALMHQR